MVKQQKSRGAKGQKGSVTERSRKLAIEEVRKVAKLANLTLAKEEVEKLGGQLSETVSYVEVLDELDTKGTEPTFQVAKQVNRWRGDEVKASLTQKEALSNAKNTYKGYFVVPYVFSSS